MHAVFDASSITEKEGSQSPVLDPNKRVGGSKRGPLIIPKQGLKKPLSGYILSLHTVRTTAGTRSTGEKAGMMQGVSQLWRPLIATSV